MSVRIASSKPKLICVDDEAVVLSAVSRLMEKHFEVFQAKSALQALELIRLHPDTAILLSDHSLEGSMSGLDLLSEVRRANPDIVRALLTGRIELSQTAQMINTQLVHRLILKPWDNDYLLVQMQESLASHETLVEKSRLEHLAVTDVLTGLKNRRYFDANLEVEVDRAIRHGRPLSILLVDVDHFKEINDQRGHSIGDVVLKEVAHRLNRQLRSIDTMCRQGGDEFAALLPDTPFDSALRVAERIRMSFENTRIDIAGHSPLIVTLSLGVAACPDHSITAKSLVERADAALYKAKQLGRNQSRGA